MANKITVDTLKDFEPMNNNLVVKHISDSIEDEERDNKLNSKIIVVRNEGNRKREKSVGKVVSVAPELFVMNGDSKCITPECTVIYQNVIYDTMSRLVEITIKEFPDDKFYLIRFPDIIAVIEEE